MLLCPHIIPCQFKIWLLNPVINQNRQFFKELKAAALYQRLSYPAFRTEWSIIPRIL